MPVGVRDEGADQPVDHAADADPSHPAGVGQRDRYGLPLDRLASESYDARFQVDEDGNPTTGFPTGAEWYESVVPVVTFEGSEAVEIRYYPIELGWKAPRSQRGTPRIAPEELGCRPSGAQSGRRANGA